MELEGQIGSGDVGASMSDSEMDAAISAESPSREIPMSAPKAQAAPTPQEYTLKIKGQEIKAPLDKVLQWAQMGYDYPQRAAELNKQQQEFQKRQQEIAELEKKWSPYKEVDEYAAKNPDWWQQVQAQYKQKIAGAETNPEVAALKQELAELKAFRDELKNEKQSQKILEEDQKLSQEVESIRKTYSNIDFDTPNEEGLSLEMQVLKHANENGIPTFKAAFRDYYHDHLLSKAREEGKELVSKEVQKRTKLGILGETSKPTKGLKPAENVKDKSYEQLAREALDELGA